MTAFFVYSCVNVFHTILVSSIGLQSGGLIYNLVLQRHTGQTTLLQVLNLGNKLLFDNKKNFFRLFIVDVVDKVD